MYISAAILLFFLNIVLSSVAGEGNSGRINIALRVSSLDKDKIVPVRNNILQFYGDTSTETKYYTDWTKKKIPFIVPPESFQEKTLEMIHRKAIEFEKTFVFPFKLRITKMNVEDFVKMANRTSNRMDLYIYEIRSIVERIKENYTIITDFSLHFFDIVIFLFEIRYSGIIIIACNTEKEMRIVLEYQKWIPDSLIVCIEKDTGKKLEIVLRSSKFPLIEAVLPPRKKESTVSMLAGCFVFMGFITIISSSIYLLATQRTQAVPRPKTVKNKDIKKITAEKYMDISKSIADTTPDCIICFEKFLPTSICRILPCNHFYHSSCIDTWLISYSNRCPYCQKPVELV